MARFTSITIIYNPNSTGSGKELAQELKQALATKLPNQPVTITPTKHAGHAETLAIELSKASKRPLIISASGDGGYHEVVNGIMQANQDGATSVAGLLPAGNANDHFHALHDIDTAVAIAKDRVRHIDVLKLTATIKGKPFVRFAHSYIGIGLTPKVGRELNKTDLNRFNEVWIVLRTLVGLRPVRVLIKGKKRSFDSLIFSNVSKMSKVLTLASEAELTDGKFEITAFKRRSKLRLFTTLIRGATQGIDDGAQADHYSFKTVKPTIVQLDGEIETLDQGCEVTISLMPKALDCIV